DYDENIYETVLIGEQCWMKENLRTTHYADGTFIPLKTTTISSNTAYRYLPDENENNVSIYGYLYNRPAAMHGESGSSANPSNVQGICPNGWHLPSDAEWTQLTDYLSSHSEYQCDDVTTKIAKSLASTTGWRSSTTTCAVGNIPENNNSTGFSVYPAGDYNGSYNDFGRSAYFWSATGLYDGAAGYYRNLVYSNSNVNRHIYDNFFGVSVRCIRD
ncbi:MAG: fibrobacter succinogenes major paralogous domain-containing protein, partial [Bacteroidales bacterium]|nr:fibrobacter succinogenes major paralogous domain-containing protein [Bacteroidales bacterium]